MFQAPGEKWMECRTIYLLRHMILSLWSYYKGAKLGYMDIWPSPVICLISRF